MPKVKMMETQVGTSFSRAKKLEIVMMLVGIICSTKPAVVILLLVVAVLVKRLMRKPKLMISAVSPPNLALAQVATQQKGVAQKNLCQ